MFTSIELIVLVIGLTSILKVSPVSGGKKGQSIIMDGGSLIMTDNDKKKKGDTIVISGSRECETKKVHVPYPVMVPQKQVKYVHVPVHIPVPVHHHGGHHHLHGGWFNGGIGHEEIMSGGFARSDEIIGEPMERPLIGIGERLTSIDYDISPESETRSMEPLPSMGLNEELGIYQ